MQIKDAVAKAKEFASSIFADENPTTINLEQAIFDDVTNQWEIVLSLHRFKQEGTVGSTLANLSGGTRSLKLFKVDASSGDIDSVEIWTQDE